MTFIPFLIAHMHAHCCRLEAVLYSLTAVAAEILALRHQALGPLQQAATWASTACTKSAQQHPAAGRQQRGQQQQQQQQKQEAAAAAQSAGQQQAGDQRACG